MLKAPTLESYITLPEVIKAIDGGQRFDITVVKADVKRGTGGALATYTGCIKQRPKNGKTAETKKQSTGTKSPNHYENSTRNIYLLREREIKKIHLRLIVRFNGKKVS